MYELNSILINGTLVFTNYVVLFINQILFTIEVNLYYLELFNILKKFNDFFYNNVNTNKRIFYYDLALFPNNYGIFKLNELLFNNYLKDTKFINYIQNSFLTKSFIEISSLKIFLELYISFFKALFFTAIFSILYYYIGDNIIKYSSKIKIFKTLVKEIDQEFANFEDFFFWFFFISSIILYSTNYISITKVLAISMYTYLILIIATVFFIPYYIVIVFLNDLSSKIRGHSKENSNYIHSLLDYMTFTAFCLRFILQCIRWVLIICTYILFHEYFFEIKVNVGVNDLNNFLGIDTKKMYRDNLNLHTFSIFRILFEYLDVLFVAFVQTVAFFVVILWLFNFLFSYSSTNWLENFLFFNDKNYKNNNKK